jgi:hypothetical protein
MKPCSARLVEAFELTCHACRRTVSFPVAAVRENAGQCPLWVTGPEVRWQKAGRPE